MNDTTKDNFKVSFKESFLSYLNLYIIGILISTNFAKHTDFRYYMHQYFPNILEGYYVIGEKLSGSNQLRRFDNSTWTQDCNEH